MPSTIRAAVCRAFNAPLTIETLTLRDPGPGEVAVKIDAVAICHSDISLAEGAWGGDLPAVYGHEAAGHITELGPNVRGYQVGQPVLVTLIRSCANCPSCAVNQPVYCTGNPPLVPVLTDETGAVVHKSMDTGAFAEKVIVDPSQIAPLGDAVPTTVASVLACGVLTGVGAVVNTAQVRPGESVAVIGAGGVGLNVIQGARLTGAARIIAVDLEPTKLDDARAFGATDTVLATAPDPWQRVHTITGGRGADHVFVSVGAVSAYEAAPRMLGMRGKMYAVGMTHAGATAQYEPVMQSYLGHTIKGSRMGEVVLKRDIPWMLDLYAQKRLMLDELISKTWQLEEINMAIAETKSGRARRNVIVF